VVATKDSKELISKAFQQILNDRKRIDSRIATKEEEAEKEKNQQILEVASTYTIDGIVKGLADLQLEFGNIVKGLSEKLAKEASKLDELNRASALKLSTCRSFSKFEWLPMPYTFSLKNIRKSSKRWSKMQQISEKS
jgi:hypothetical protein